MPIAHVPVVRVGGGLEVRRQLIVPTNFFTNIRGYGVRPVETVPNRVLGESE
jgi:hypothetical protein